MTDQAHRAELEQIATEYRAAFEEVQSLLAAIDLGKLPSYVFAIDRYEVEALRELNPQLGEAEQRRRQWRAALHAMAELTALETGAPSAGPGRPGAVPTFDPDAPEPDGLAELEASGSDMDSLDRFISVVQYARTVGCMYVDGGFRPVFKQGPS